MILYGKSVKYTIPEEGRYGIKPYENLKYLLEDKPIGSYPNLEMLLSADAKVGERPNTELGDGTSVKCGSRHAWSKGFGKRISELTPTTSGSLAKFRELCWAIEMVEQTLIYKTRPYSVEYYLFPDYSDLEGTVSSIIKNCITQITMNVIEADKAFREGKSVSGRYLSIIRHLNGKEITRSNILDVIYKKVKRTYNPSGVGYTSSIRKEIQEVVLAKFGYTRSSHPEWLEHYVLFEKCATKNSSSIHSRLRSIFRTHKIKLGVERWSSEEDMQTIMTQEFKDFWVFCYKLEFGEAPQGSIEKMIKTCYYIITNNMDYLKKYIEVEGSGVKQVYSKIRVDNDIFKSCFKLILCYIILSKFGDMVKEGAKSAIQNYLYNCQYEYGNCKLAGLLKSDIESLLN